MSLSLTAPEFDDTNAARKSLEASRCLTARFAPHCGVFNVMRLGGEGHRPGLLHCRDCPGQLALLIGSIMAFSHIPPAKWLPAIQLMNSSEKDLSAHRLHRMLGITHKSA